MNYENDYRRMTIDIRRPFPLLPEGVTFLSAKVMSSSLTSDVILKIPASECSTSLINQLIYWVIRKGGPNLSMIFVKIVNHRQPR